MAHYRDEMTRKVADYLREFDDEFNGTGYAEAAMRVIDMVRIEPAAPNTGMIDAGASVLEEWSNIADFHALALKVYNAMALAGARGT